VIDTHLVLGGTNFHQDPHFSTYYLGASIESASPPHYPGYSFVLAVYENDRERYYVSSSEAEQTSNWIIQRAVADPKWLWQILEEIENLSENLVDVFPADLTPRSLRAAARDELVAIYEEHNSRHNALYRFARLPEALDRGLPWFTNYLRTHLLQAGVQEKELPYVFDLLTQPLKPSVIAEAEAAFSAIVLLALQACPLLPDAPPPLMTIDARVREELRGHRERWGCLYYHGFRNRTLPTESEYVARLQKEMSRVHRGNREISVDCKDVRNIDVPELDHAHAELFRVYAEIGRVKLARRFAQLRNFYFLDQLIGEFARRLEASEWEVRCSMPDELLEALATGKLAPDIKERTTRCAVLFTHGARSIVYGQPFEDLLTKLRVPEPISVHANIRLGTPACLGVAKGKARVIDVSTTAAANMSEGDILVCDAIDPDLLPIIRKASAVVTEQGGVASHAAVLCREMGIPTVVGVANLLGFCNDGDELEVNATLGRITRLKRERDELQLQMPPFSTGCSSAIGLKAANLDAARSNGFRIPPYVLLSWNRLLEAHANAPGRLAPALERICKLLGPANPGLPDFIFRSTALDEDMQFGQRGRAYISVPFSISESIPAVQQFVSTNRQRGYSGVVILQRFLPATACGVWLDSEPGASSHCAAIEAVLGPFNTVTSGRGTVTRYFLDDHGGVCESSDSHTTPEFFPIHALVDWIAEVKEMFGSPVCVEWGFLDGAYWLYQVRTIHSLKTPP
jgi:phosphohistidine swiveling domain-containing protein